jgi:hypothetical protein
VKFRLLQATWIYPPLQSFDSFVAVLLLSVACLLVPSLLFGRFVRSLYPSSDFLVDLSPSAFAISEFGIFLRDLLFAPYFPGVSLDQNLLFGLLCSMIDSIPW